MLNKKGEFTTKEILEIVLSAAVFLLLATLLYQLIAPNFNKDDETVKSYFKSFKGQVEIADSEKTGLFSIWQPKGEKDEREFYLVYFGNSSSYEKDRTFYSLEKNLNHICICYWEEEDTICSSCENLKYPVLAVGLDEDDSGRWAIGIGQKIEIMREGETYEIKKV